MAQQYFTAEESFAVKLGRTKPIYETASIPSTDIAKLKERKANKPKVIPNFGGRRHLESQNPNALPIGIDPLYDPHSSRMPKNEILPLVNFEGLSEAQSGSTPPDVNGDVGRDYYVEIVNSTFFRVYNKSGTAVSNVISANSIWNQVQQSSAGDPILLYDQEVDRWLLTEFPSNNRVLVAISLTNDPRGSWDAYAFQTPRFPDFPKYGIWPDAYYLTTNESGGNFPIYAINREDILAGVDVARIQRLTVPKIGGVFFEVGQPVDWDGMTRPPLGSPGLVVKLNDDGWGTTPEDKILLHKIQIDWTNANASNIEVISIPTAPFDTDGCLVENTGGFSCVPQPNGQGIDGAQWIITNKAQYRNFGSHESFVMCFMVDVTGADVAGIRWMEFRKTSTEDWHIYQEGTVGSDDGLHRFMASIGIDGRGNIGLGYSVSGFDKFPSLRYTGRYATDPPGTMTFEEFEFATGSGSQNFDRYGDYASMSVDPSDDATFWFAGEYLTDNNEWSTRVVAFLAHRDTIDIFPLSLLSPGDNAELGEQNVSLTLFNRGLTTVYDIPVGYQFNDGAWITEVPVVDSLAIDEEYTYIFQTPVFFDAPGTYPIRIATLLDADHNKRNDTLSFTITKYAYRDALLEYIVDAGQEFVCDDEAVINILLRNTGLDTLRHIEFALNINGEPHPPIEWAGDLAFGEETIFSFPVHLLQEGTFLFELTIERVNADVDEIMANNEISWELHIRPDGQQVHLEFKTDNFPHENTWRLFDAEQNLIASGGPYSEAQEVYFSEFCLDPEACYTFTVFDAFGDGMSSQGVQGDFEIFNSQGDLLADLAKPNFGAQSSSQFCLTAECMISLQVGVEHESFPGAHDAVVIAEVSNSLGIVLYSIDGGQNFQTSNSFQQLAPGLYMLISKDGAGCLDSVSFEVLGCNLQTLIHTLPAVGGDVGEIHVFVAGSAGPAFISINGGPFVADTIFAMLEPGDYVVTVRDSLGCESNDTVTISTSVSTKFLAAEEYIQISPNPGKGIYLINAFFNVEDIFIPYTLFTDLGEVLFRGTIVRYGDTYKGEVSLIAFPPGVYYIAFSVDHQIGISRVIKVE